MRSFVRSPLFVLVVFLVLGGICARLYGFTVPRGLIYDEHHFVEMARSYLRHEADRNDHPPLGKLVIAASIWAFGDTSLGWRLPSEILGLATVVLAAIAAARMFKSAVAGGIAGALIASDGFFISYSRVAVLDGQLVFLLAISLLLTTFRWRLSLAAIAGVLLGTACTVKFSGVGLVPLFAAGLLLDAELSTRARLTRALVIVAVAAATFFTIYSFGLWMAGQPSGLGAVVNDCQRIVSLHSRATEMKNPFVSSWPTWFVPTRPLGFYGDEHLGEVRMVTMLGNLATWWTASLMFFGALFWVARDGAHAIRRSVSGRATLVLLAAAIGFLAPWVVTRRDSYLYHYFPTYFALVLMTAGWVVWLREKRSLLATGFMCSVALVGALYGPLWCSLPVGIDTLHARLFLEGWR